MKKFLGNKSRDARWKLGLGVAILGLGVAIFLYESRPVPWVENFTLSVVEPIFNAGVVLREKTMTFGSAASVFSGELVAENQKLKAQLFAVMELGAEVDRLRRALALQEREGVPLEGARVVLYTRELGKEFLIIDKGKRDGIVQHFPVVDSNFILVGVVREVHEDYAKVEVASNAGHTYEVELLPLGIRAVAKGIGARIFSIELIPENTPVRRGDFVGAVSSRGKNTLMLLGEIASEKLDGNGGFKNARALHLARPELLHEIFFVRE